MLARADQYLAAVDDAYILKERGHSVRQMPTFRPEEICVGRELGRGGFGVVCEIQKFVLDAEEPERNTTETPQPSSGGEDENETSNKPKIDGLMSKSNHYSEIADSEHYAVDKARHVMANRVLKNGTPRYALKLLHSELSQVEKARGMIDLALEAKYLSIVWHPNISKY